MQIQAGMTNLFQAMPSVPPNAQVSDPIWPAPADTLW